VIEQRRTDAMVAVVSFLAVSVFVACVVAAFCGAGCTLPRTPVDAGDSGAATIYYVPGFDAGPATDLGY
jgi:hypothetical protein